MRRATLETTVGLFVLVGVAALAWLSIRLGKVELPGRSDYSVHAVFSNVEGLSPGTAVAISGVEVGRVARIELRNYRAVVTMRIARTVRLSDDAIVSVRTRGLVGEKFLSITPGASEAYVQPGGTLHETEDALDLEHLISEFIHGRVK